MTEQEDLACIVETEGPLKRNHRLGQGPLHVCAEAFTAERLKPETLLVMRASSDFYQMALNAYQVRARFEAEQARKNNKPNSTERTTHNEQ